MPAGSLGQNEMLAYLLLGSTGSRPTAWTVGLSLGSPTQAALSEVGAGSGYTRQLVTFKSSNVNTFTNSVAIKFGPFSSVATISGCFILDQNGSLLLYGTLSAATAVAVGSSASFPAGSLRVALS